MPIPKDKQQKIGLAAIITALLLFGLYQFWISSNLQDWQAARKEVAAYEAKIQKAQQVIADAKKRQPELLAASQTMSRFELSLPQSDAYAWMVSEMDVLTRRHNIKLTAVEATPPVLRPKKEDTPGFGVRAFLVKFYAGYDDFGELLRDVENAFPSAELVNVEMASGSADPLLQGAKFTLETLVKQ